MKREMMTKTVGAAALMTFGASLVAAFQAPLAIQDPHNLTNQEIAELTLIVLIGAIASGALGVLWARR